MTAPSALVLDSLPLFPLQTVLFPQGLLKLRVFETRYLDLVTLCLRTGAPFGVVCILEGSEVRQPGDKPLRFEAIGVLAHVRELDAEQSGILILRCQGSQRFTLSSPSQRADGLWLAKAQVHPDDETQAVPPELARCADALGDALVALAAQGHNPVPMPHRLNDAGWVANRWCELLPIPIAAKQRLMALDEPVMRLTLVDDYLRGKGVV